MKIVDEYYNKFKEFPPIVTTMDYTDKLYQKLIRQSIINNVKLEMKDITKYIDYNKFDLVVPDEKLNAYQYEIRHQKR